MQTAERCSSRFENFERPGRLLALGAVLTQIFVISHLTHRALQVLSRCPTSFQKHPSGQPQRLAWHCPWCLRPQTRRWAQARHLPPDPQSFAGAVQRSNKLPSAPQWATAKTCLALSIVFAPSDTTIGAGETADRASRRVRMAVLKSNG